MCLHSLAQISATVVRHLLPSVCCRGSPCILTDLSDKASLFTHNSIVPLGLVTRRMDAWDDSPWLRRFSICTCRSNHEPLSLSLSLLSPWASLLVYASFLPHALHLLNSVIYFFLIDFFSCMVPGLCFSCFLLLSPAPPFSLCLFSKCCFVSVETVSNLIWQQIPGHGGTLSLFF